MSTLVVICGISFAGKSTLARAITERLGFVEVDVDAVGARLYGLPANDGGAQLNGLDFDRIYDEADKEIERLLTSGVSVDASRNFTRSERTRARELARRANARLVTVFVDTAESVARQRRVANKISGSRGDITDDQFDEILRVFEPPSEDERPLVFGIGDDIDSWAVTNAPAMNPN